MMPLPFLSLPLFCLSLPRPSSSYAPLLSLSPLHSLSKRTRTHTLQRVDMYGRWRHAHGSSRLVKLSGALTPWVEKLPLPLQMREKFLDDVIGTYAKQSSFEIASHATVPLSPTSPSSPALSPSLSSLLSLSPRRLHRNVLERRTTQHIGVETRLEAAASEATSYRK